MTIRQALTALDSAQFNTVDREEKLGWLSRLDAQAANYVSSVTGQPHPFAPYNADTDLETALLLPPPYDQAYPYWLEACADYRNQEYDRYNNAMAMYNTVWSRFEAHCVRNCKPKTNGNFYE